MNTDMGLATTCFSGTPNPAFQSQKSKQPPQGAVSFYGVLELFATLLAITTFRHEMYRDEAQAWWIARNSRTILDVIQHLHYEGHPALWYLLIYVPSHFSRSMVWIQIINFIFAIAFSWLVLSEHRINFTLRVLILFSSPVFFAMGVVARSYMLSTVLLVAASRWLIGERPRHWLSMGMLALAINSHFLAIPIALNIFVWMYWITPDRSWKAAVQRFTEWRFWFSSLIIGLSLIICYFTVRPASDIYNPHFERSGVSYPEYLILGIGRIWQYLFPIRLDMFSAGLRELLAPSHRPSLLATGITIGLWLVV